MRVLVTGAGGFIGQHLLARLQADGVEVHGIGRRSMVSTPATWHALDLFDDDARRTLLQRLRPSHLIHLAWTTAHGRYWQDPANQAWVAMSLALLRDFADAGGRHAVYAGSCAEDDWSGSGAPPASRYGRCKAALRLLACDLAEQLELSLAWGRIYFPFGPGEQGERLVPSIARRLLDGQPAPTGPAGLERDFVYVEDLAAMLALLSRCEHAGSLDLCSGEPTRIGDLAGALADLLGRRELLRLGELPGRPGDPQRLLGDAAGLRALGWDGGLGLAEGLRRSVRALQS
ncbi:NAD-dependent epimerase/dehydratase family protein [Roseateles violae]|uniref:NAD-dependent epimerase/dehydratase family protein n=1 Tax=Roseateles violae TaxID=3058042 RepID=A0ABT8DXK4_9BURK|nr:NAD-dependent epimerase/dehydratase family protein [Pelomonas sp. PFR6]MDN3921587.1 NAD-dependent epimerase/dehydratase family protein [Pelomonas sp. PFR6]